MQLKRYRFFVWNLGVELPRQAMDLLLQRTQWEKAKASQFLWIHMTRSL